ncbi:hypothetical protein MRX96_028590 [Rhipicephalus microplus]
MLMVRYPTKAGRKYFLAIRSFLFFFLGIPWRPYVTKNRVSSPECLTATYLTSATAFGTGVVVYMAYGVWHSSERQNDDPECSLLENVMCDDVSSDDVLPLAEQRREVLVETF